jgi:filamentous hemagglutinin
VSLGAGRDLALLAGEATETLEQMSQSTKRGFLKKKTTTTYSKTEESTALGTVVSGKTLDLEAGRDLQLRAAQAVSDQGTTLVAGGDITLDGVNQRLDSEQFSKTVKSGLFGGGGLGVTLGKQSLSQTVKSSQTQYQGSVVGAVDGDVSITAAGAYRQTGSELQAPGGDISIQAKTVDIVEAREQGSQSTQTQFKQSGLTVAVTSPVLSALQTASSQIKAAGQSGDSRVKALAAANVALNAKQAVDAVKGGQGQVPTGQKNPDGSSVMTDGNAADKAGGIGISISLGASRSQSQQSSSADLARGSSVTAGGDISIRATGGGQDSDLTLRGSTVQAGGKTRLQADDQIKILAAQNLTQESNSQSSQSGSIGVGINLGAGGLKAGVTVSASAGKGQGAGNSSTYTNSQIAGSQVTLQSGGDTTIKGGVVQGERVIAQVGGNLTIESLQDKSQYKEKSQQVGGSVTIGPSPGGSLSAGQTKINSDYLSVGEQSAIRAGDGGFDVRVAGKTELTGAQITSTQAAIDSGKNRYEAQQGTSTTDLQNSASYEAKSVSVGLGAGTPAPGKSLSAGLSGVGIGSDSGSASSTSTAGISGIAGNTAARTGDAESGLKPIFDKDKARQEVNAQVAITSEFGKQASKAVGDYAKQQYDKAKEAGDKDGMAAWEEGGKNRVALHVLVGGLTGGVQGAVGAGAASVAAPKLEELQAGLKTALKDAGLGDSAANLISGLAGGATAATIGAAASGGSTAGAATAFNADMNNRQLHPDERRKAADLARKSGGKYTQEEIENALRNAGNNDKGESVIAGLVVDPKERNAIYDKASVWTTGENGRLVQVLPPQPPADLVAYIKANTGDTYSWYTPSSEPAANSQAPRDRLTNLPLDDKGRYSRTIILDGKAYQPKFHPCATAECQVAGKNLDLSDPGTKAYIKALDQQVFKDIGTGATAGTMATPVGTGAGVLFWLGAAASIGQSVSSETPGKTASDEALKVMAEKGGEKFFTEILGHTPGAAARATALINLAGGWDAFVNRLKIDIFGVKSDEAKK